MVNVKPVKLGRNTRMSFSKINEVMQMPNLIEVQKNSYKWFLETGLKEVFRDIDAITDFTGNLELTFVDYRMDDKPKYAVKELKELPNYLEEKTSFDRKAFERSGCHCV